jgi:t-SNARE complex subunit (syntaxin)
MYETLNEIVQEQGETLTKIETNVSHTKRNTSQTVKELQKTLKLQTSGSEVCGRDFGLMCLSVWFIVALFFFLIDLTM